MITAGRLHRLWRDLPIGTLNDVIGDKSCLILAPHPDDESLGCGGLIAACCAAARAPIVVILTDGSASHPGSAQYPPAKLAALREHETMRAVHIFGLPLERLRFLREPDSKAPRAGPAFDAVVLRICDWLHAFDCSAILAPWRLDPHGDHAAAAEVAAETSNMTGVRLVSYPVWGWTLQDDALVQVDAVNGWRLDVHNHLERKRRAIAEHASQYTPLITDDPAGFRLPTGLLQAMDQPWETFLQS